MKRMIIIAIGFCFVLLAKEGEFVPTSELDSLFITSKNIDFNSPVFNRDSIEKYNYDGYIHPLRSYRYPNNTGLTDDELFKRYKLYQKYLKKGGEIKTKMIPYKIAMVAEFRRVFGENPYKYVGSGKYCLEYEITEILYDAYEFYKIGDKIKVYQDVFIEDENLSFSYAKYVFLTMSDKHVYDVYRFENDRIEKSSLPIVLDMYSTRFYIKFEDSNDDFDLYTIEELREIYKDVKKVKKEKSEPIYWYDYNFESLMENSDE